MKNLQITAQITPRDSRTVDTYLRDIAQQPLLTVDEEVELAQRIRQGDERALERLVLGNLRFVVSVAKKYQNRGLPSPTLSVPATSASSSPPNASTKPTATSSAPMPSGGYASQSCRLSPRKVAP